MFIVPRLTREKERKEKKNMYPKQSINYLIVTSRIIPQVAAGHNIRLGFFCFILVINMRLELGTTDLQTNIL